MPPTTPHCPICFLAGRPALLKVQLTGSGSSPETSATVTAKSGEEMTLTLAGPDTLPSVWNGEPGKVEHKLEDSFTATVPADWVAHGMAIEVHATGKNLRFELAVGAPSAIKMLMYDVHYFGQGDGDYPSGWEAELASKWPVANFTASRVRDLKFDEMVIPARSAGAPTVRVRSENDYKKQTGLNFDGEQAAALQWVHALSASGGNQDTQISYVNILGVPAGGQVLG